MPSSDIFIVLKWWAMFVGIGLIFLPSTVALFSRFFDKGYIFSKILGMGVISYLVFLLGVFKILPFTLPTILTVIVCSVIFNFFISYKKTIVLDSIKRSWKMFLLEEVLFLAGLLFWAYVRAHQPDIHGLEKYEDFGFINSILRSKYFPPADMWFTPYSINYYYFGHLITGVLTKLSSISSYISFNLMLSTIFSLSFTASFSIAVNLFREFELGQKNIIANFRTKIIFICGLLAGFLTTLSGNLHTLYSFFKPYPNESPVPFWQLVFSPQTFPNAYWYPNATRFIPYTIHEFPPYSFVVSDLHAHVLDMPFVFLTIAVALNIFISKTLSVSKIILISLLLAIMYMTNAWDGPIYFLLIAIVIFTIKLKPVSSFSKLKSVKDYIFKAVLNKDNLSRIAYPLFFILVGFLFFSLPFNLNFKPFASGIGVLCAPKFLTNMGKLGPFIFEANHCQRSPLWQLIILYGFFYFWVISFGVFLYKNFRSKKIQINSIDVFVGILILLSTLLIIIPEFFYIKDIYPLHYRANTMFKLIFQAFIMLSLCSSYIIIRLFLNRDHIFANYWYLKLFYWIAGLATLFLVSIYPYFSINSYFGNLKIYYGLDGTTYLKTLYPDDYAAILWINKNIRGQPVMLEAQGDSYSDSARVSANTGLPTVLGWTVHEWLWRGSYGVPAPRIPEISKIYESKNFQETKSLLKKYNVKYVFIGTIERQKYLNLDENKFESLGEIIYQSGTKIFKISY